MTKKDIEYLPGVALESDQVNFLSGPHGYTAKIQEALGRAKHEFLYIGMLLIEVDNNQYYREAGFNDIYEYCESTFEFKRSSTNNFMRVYRKFGEAMGLKEAYRGYGYSQLTEMCSMSDRQIAECSPEMSISRIREIKKTVPEYLPGTSLAEQRESTLKKLQDHNKLESVQTSGFANQSDVGVSISPDHYIALELYLENRFSGKCRYEKWTDFIEAVNGTGCDFILDVKSGVHTTIYRVSLIFNMDGAHIKLNGVSARISPAGCFYLLKRNAGMQEATYRTR